MKLHPFCFATVMLLLALTGASATTFYVDVNSANPTPPYSDWSTASTDIQSAIDAASDGDQILVTNGVYQTGGRTVNGYALTNRVVIDKAMTVQSVNGPSVTVIQGYQISGILVGDSAVRCVYLTNSAVLSGFTLVNGATRQTGDVTNEQCGGGVFCESTNVLISNCIVNSNSCGRNGGGVYSGTLTSCQIINNKNNFGLGGGAVYSTLFDCTISGNTRALSGGGAHSCYLSNCVVSVNSPGGVANSVLDYCTVENNTNVQAVNIFGGGASQSTLNHCLIRKNQAQQGGGVYQCEINFCTVSNNWAINNGGGVYEVAGSTNKIGSSNQITGNWAGWYGGGLYEGSSPTDSDFSGWTFTSNSAVRDGGGMYRTWPVNNCVFIGNSAGGNGGGLCRPGGAYVAVTNCTFVGNVASGNGGGAYYAALENCSMIGNQAGGNGGGVYGIANNCVINSNTASIAGGGICSYINGIAPAINHCTFTNNLASRGGGASNALGGGNPVFTNCVFFANYAITNGGGAYGETLKSCLIISNQAKFGGGGCLGAYFDCTFIGNMASDSGGGIYSLNGAPISWASNCVFTANHASINGGGAYGSLSAPLERCSLFGNSAGTNGGGSYGSTLANCLLTGNSAINGGGAYLGSLYNSTFIQNTATSIAGGVYSSGGVFIQSCIIYSNNAPNNPNYVSGAITFSCTTPLPPGNGNITNQPIFINFSANNFRLQTNSPCINTGIFPNPYGSGAIDLDGRPRLVGGRLDMGAYEFQGPGMGEFIGWLQQYGLPTDGSADYLDSDNDRMNNWQEWVAGTVPTNAVSVLLLASPSNSVSGLTLTWQSVNTRTYFLQSSTNLSAMPAFYSIQSNLVGQAGTTAYMDTSATNGGPYFYRVGIQ